MGVFQRTVRQGLWLALLAGGVGACGPPPVLTRLTEARQTATGLHVQFAKAAEAANRAVIASTDEGAAAAAREANLATEGVQREADRLKPLLQSLGYADEQRAFESFVTCFAEHRGIDTEVLRLAVENTNLKAQRLSFGPAREALGAFRRALEAANQRAADSPAAATLIARAQIAVLEIQVLHGPHVWEPEDTAMTQMEEHMAASEATARQALAQLQSELPGAARDLDAATAALDRYRDVTREMLALSRQNTNVRSVALALGRKRALDVQCDDHLRTLQEALAKHASSATR
jgi:hypothetical protein